VNGNLPEKTGRIVLNLESGDSRFLGPFFACMMLVFGLLLSPLIPLGGTWPLCLGMLALSAPVFGVLYRRVRPFQGASLIIDGGGIELVRKGHRVFHCAWRAIASVEISEQEFRTPLLALKGEDGRVQGEIPLNHALRFHELMGLVGRHLPYGVQIKRVVPGLKGTQGGRGLIAIFLTGGAIASLAYAFAGISTIGATGLAARLPALALLLGLVLIPVALVQWKVALLWKRRNLEPRLEPVRNLFVHALLSDIHVLLSGRAVPTKRTYSYSPSTVKANAPTTPKQQVGTATFISLLLAALVLGAEWSAFQGLSLAFLIPIMTASALLTILLPFYLMRKVVPQVDQIRAGLGDQIIVENLAIWVVKDGRKRPAHLIASPTYNDSFAAANGLNRMRMPLAVGDEVLWYDPSSMFDEVGVQMLEQGSSGEPRTLRNERTEP